MQPQLREHEAMAPRGDAPAMEREPSPATRDRLAIPVMTVASVISSMGNQLTSIAIPWFVYVTTDSAARTGVVGAVVSAASITGGILGGPIVDRLRHKYVSIVSDIASAVTVAMVPTLYYLDMLQFWHILALIFLGTILDAPGGAARFAMIPALARRAGTPLERANAGYQIGQVTASIIGPVTAGALIALMGAAALLYVDAASFVVSALLIAVAISLPAIRRKREDAAQQAAAAGKGGAAKFVADIREGFRFIIHDRLMRAVMPVSIGANLLFNALFGVAFPVYAKEVFDDSTALGLIVASFGLGSLAGMIVYGLIGHRIQRYPVWVVTCVCAPIGLFLMPWAPSIAVAVMGGIISGVVMGPINTIFTTVMQERVPETLYGRVMGATMAIGQAATPLGILAAGLLIDWLDVRVVMAGIAASLALLFIPSIFIPAIRLIDRPAPTPSPVTD